MGDSCSLLFCFGVCMTDAEMISTITDAFLVGCGIFLFCWVFRALVSLFRRAVGVYNGGEG